MIVATAGHIDHGKTLLVKALTGIDADRLPEEKERGLTIDLGFAYLPIEDGPTIGFIDVPGHERFIRNMLAGVSGIDLALVIVAADDGVMPQTEEHLAILDILDVRRGAVVITKIDRVEKQRIKEVIDDTHVLLAGTSLEGARIFEVSALNGTGIMDLRSYLERSAHETPSRAITGGFRLAIDRNFLLKGAGLVVTGTVFAGMTHPGDRLLVTPGGHEVRVRSIHSQNYESNSGKAGQRCALNLTGRGIDRDTISRGDWLVSPNLNSPSLRFDARLKILATETRPLRHWTPVHVHAGAAALTGRIALLEDRSISSGQVALVQIVLDSPTALVFGDRFVIRDQSARRTIGGGRVIDPFAPRRGRRTTDRLKLLKATSLESSAEALQGMCKAASNGISIERFATARNLSSDDAASIAVNSDLIVASTGDIRTALTSDRWDHLRSGIVKAITTHHSRTIDSRGMSIEELNFAVGDKVDKTLLEAAASDLVAAGKLVAEGGLLREAGHQVALPPQDARLWEKIRPALEVKEGRPPSVPDLAEKIGMDTRRLEQFLVKLGRQGLTVQISRNRFMTPAMIWRLAKIAEGVASSSSNQRFTARSFRDETALGRNLTIEVLEFFDRSGFTRRIGDERSVLKPAADAFMRLHA